MAYDFFEELGMQVGLTKQQASASFARAVRGAQYRTTPQCVVPVPTMLACARRDPKGRAQLQAFLDSRKAA